MKRLLVMAIFALVFITTSAQAADKGMYASGNIGLSLLSDGDASIPGLFTAEGSYDLGFMVGGALGYDFGAFRAEGEIAYRTNDFDEASSGGVTLPAEGDTSALSFMAN